mmetsp:Transcript_27814/g.62944  ORF Transcript_27814/g.62944 Transcript_27814/m.62944 type:complete len:251 (+) Transcript_27814:2641-3393(+)
MVEDEESVVIGTYSSTNVIVVVAVAALESFVTWSVKTYWTLTLKPSVYIESWALLGNENGTSLTRSLHVIPCTLQVHVKFKVGSVRPPVKSGSFDSVASKNSCELPRPILESPFRMMATRSEANRLNDELTVVDVGGFVGKVTVNLTEYSPGTTSAPLARKNVGEFLASTVEGINPAVTTFASLTCSQRNCNSIASLHLENAVLASKMMSSFLEYLSNPDKLTTGMGNDVRSKLRLNVLLLIPRKLTPCT